MHIWNIFLATAAALSSTTQTALSVSDFLYPYGGRVASGFPEFPFALKTACIFFEQPRAYTLLLKIANKLNDHKSTFSLQRDWYKHIAYTSLFNYVPLKQCVFHILSKLISSKNFTKKFL